MFRMNKNIFALIALTISLVACSGDDTANENNISDAGTQPDAAVKDDAAVDPKELTQLEMLEQLNDSYTEFYSCYEKEYLGWVAGSLEWSSELLADPNFAETETVHIKKIIGDLLVKKLALLKVRFDQSEEMEIDSNEFTELKMKIEELITQKTCAPVILAEFERKHMEYRDLGTPSFDHGSFKMVPFVGRRKVGETCNFDESCPDSATQKSFCKIDSYNEVDRCIGEGVCTAAVKINEDCTQAPCEEGLRCESIDEETATCVKKLAKGAECVLYEETCAAGLTCGPLPGPGGEGEGGEGEGEGENNYGGPGLGTCIEASLEQTVENLTWEIAQYKKAIEGISEGDACHVPDSYPCGRFSPLVCIPLAVDDSGMGTCKAATYVKKDEVCDVERSANPGILRCHAGLACFNADKEAKQGKCATLPKEGEECGEFPFYECFDDSMECSSTYNHETGDLIEQKCVVLRTTGEACDEEDSAVPQCHYWNGLSCSSPDNSGAGTCALPLSQTCLEKAAGILGDGPRL